MLENVGLGFGGLHIYGVGIYTKSGVIVGVEEGNCEPWNGFHVLHSS